MTGIEWTDSTWNPIRGCSRVSPGCQNCYAERVAARFSNEKMTVRVKPYRAGLVTEIPGPFFGFATQSPPRWTGRVALVEEHLLDPLRWRKPRRIFVNSMSDLFHESLPDEAIDRVFAVMALAPRHTFQILTKRAERMRAYLSRLDRHNEIELAAEKVRRGPLGGKHVLPRLPLPNVWLGVSVESADYYRRLTELSGIQAAVKFVSCEPLLGPLDLRPWLMSIERASDALLRDDPLAAVLMDNAIEQGLGDGRRNLDWVIVGGESGPGARPCDLAWVRSIVAQCKAAGVACFVKQLGAEAGIREPSRDPNELFTRNCGFWPPTHYGEESGWILRMKDRKGGDPEEWPEDLRVREFPK